MEPEVDAASPKEEADSAAEPAETKSREAGKQAEAPAGSARFLGWPLVAVIALTVRAAYLMTAHGTAFTHPILDADYYDALGARIAGGSGFPAEPFWQPPFYPLLLGWIYRIFGHSLWAPRIFQAALGAGAAALTCEAATRLAGKRWAGVAAGLLVALHGTLVFFDGELLPTSLAVFVAALVLWLSICVKPTAKSALALGVAVGLGALAVAPLLLLVVPAAWAVGPWRSRRPVLCLAAALLIIAPVTIMNRARSGEFVLISANGGVNLWIGNNPDVDRTMAIRPGAAWETLVSEPEREGITGAGAQSDYFVKKTAKWCASAPGACVSNLVWKARLLFVSRDLPRNEDLYVAREQSPVLAALTGRLGGLALPYTILWPLAAAGAAVALLRRTRADLLLVATAVALAAPSVMFFVTGRYRAPLAPALCVLGAVFLVEAAAPRVKPAWAPIAAALVGLGLAVMPVKLAVDRVNFRAETHYAVGGRLARLGDDEGAKKALEQALAARPDYLEAAYNLALTLERLQQYPEAVKAYDRILRRNPMMLEARVRRAGILMRTGDLAGAEKALSDLAKDSPEVPEVWIGLARLSLTAGDKAAAEVLLSKAEQAAGGKHAEAEALREEMRRADTH
ncbi:Putative O-linked GlcNAc transferase-putative TPR-containing transmembrane protein [Minicystis rosea]|nr:Putative O-linked GlcNAc transferase-putative TPR-containing transmembrane protein [Minicystis rosea]